MKKKVLNMVPQTKGMSEIYRMQNNSVPECWSSYLIYRYLEILCILLL